MSLIEEKTISGDGSCSGDCDSCGSTCSTFDPEKNTMTITTDDDQELECLVINIFQAKDQKYIVLLPKTAQMEKAGSSAFSRIKETIPVWRTLKIRMNMISRQLFLKI